jgi:hypothetical protein
VPRLLLLLLLPLLLLKVEGEEDLERLRSVRLEGESLDLDAIKLRFL